MNRRARLQSARTWLATQKGRTAVQIAKSYRKRYGLDWPCAMQELAALGVGLDTAWTAQLQRGLAGYQRARDRRRSEQLAELFEDSNETFAHIVGYTPGGAPFGVTWEELKALEAAEAKR